jgi:hypothetical protein
MFEGGDENYYWHNLEIIRKHCLKAKIPYNQIGEVADSMQYA